MYVTDVNQKIVCEQIDQYRLLTMNQLVIIKYAICHYIISLVYDLK